MVFQRVFGAIACLLLFSACSWRQVQKEEKTSLTTADVEELDQRMNQRMRKLYSSWNDEQSSQAIQSIVARLHAAQAEAFPTSQPPSPPTVVLLDSHHSMIQAGIQKNIYLSTGALKNLKFENELAFLLARELSALKLRAQQNRAELNPQQLDREATQLIYACRYDPRGGVSYLERLKPESFTERLHEVRQEIAKLSPVREPTVTTPVFERLLVAASKKDGKNVSRSTIH